jgi:thiol-disulfide isomerase/thioredoxin
MAIRLSTEAAAICLLAGLAGCTPAIHSTAPDFRFTSFDGKQGSLHKQFGKPLVVNFWAVWCGPCQAEFPDFQEVFNEKSGQFRLLSVCVDQEMDPPGFVKAKGYNWEFVYDADQSGSQAYQIRSIPRTLFFNAKGELVVDYTRGMMDKATFEENLAKIL